MITILRRAAAAAALAVALPASADLADMPAGRYTLDEQHGYILFSYSHLGFSNPQVGFNDFEVTLNLDSDDPEDSEIFVEIDASSVDSRVEDFDGHLNGADFFDTANFPTITFDSTDIERLDGSVFEVTGDLTIKGVSRPVTLTATINKAANHPMKNVPTVGVSATGTLLRSEWGLGKFTPVVSDEVELTIEVELLYAQAGE